VIGPATAALTRLGLIGSDSRLRFNIAISRGSTVAADVSIDAATFLHVKATSHGSLREEYAATVRAATIHESVVPRPIAHTAEGGWELLFTEGRQFSALQATSLRWHGVARALLDFFERAMLAGAPPQPRRHAASIERCFAGSSTPIPGQVLDAWSSGAGARLLDALPVVAQHGDFTANNIGVAPPGVVVFDWSDFGRVELPGFDLATLVLSLTGFDVKRISGLLRGPEDPLADFVQAACDRLRLDRDDLISLLPLYLAVFLSLKSNYSSTIRLEVAAALDELMQHHASH
jgi:hypothetical protein